MTDPEPVDAELVPAEPTEAAAREAFTVDQRIRTNYRRMQGMWVEIAADLHDFHERKLWRELGYSSFERWIADPGLELERRWVFDVIAIYQQLVVARGVEPSRLQQIHISKVREVLPAVRRGQAPVEEALSDAETLNRPDLEVRYRGVASSAPVAGPDGTTVVDTRAEPEWVTCGCCGSRYLRRAAS